MMKQFLHPPTRPPAHPPTHLPLYPSTPLPLYPFVQADDGVHCNHMTQESKTYFRAGGGGGGWVEVGAGWWVCARIVSSFSDHRSCPGLVQLIPMQNMQCETSACRCSSSKVSAATVSMMRARRATAMSAFTLLQCLCCLEGHGHLIV